MLQIIGGTLLVEYLYYVLSSIRYSFEGYVILPSFLRIGTNSDKICLFHAAYTLKLHCL